MEKAILKTRNWLNHPRNQKLDCEDQVQVSPVCCSMPNANWPIFWSCQNNREFWVETNSWNIVCMTFKCLHTALSLVVPHLSTTNPYTRRSVSELQDKWHNRFNPQDPFITFVCSK
jgi:hypothetical protein